MPKGQPGGEENVLDDPACIAERPREPVKPMVRTADKFSR